MRWIVGSVVVIALLAVFAVSGLAQAELNLFTALVNLFWAIVALPIRLVYSAV